MESYHSSSYTKESLRESSSATIDTLHSAHPRAQAAATAAAATSSSGETSTDPDKTEASDDQSVSIKTFSSHISSSIRGAGSASSAPAPTPANEDSADQAQNSEASDIFRLDSKPPFRRQSTLKRSNTADSGFSGSSSDAVHPMLFEKRVVSHNLQDTVGMVSTSLYSHLAWMERSSSSNSSSPEEEKLRRFQSLANRAQIRTVKLSDDDTFGVPVGDSCGTPSVSAQKPAFRLGGEKNFVTRGAVRCQALWRGYRQRKMKNQALAQQSRHSASVGTRRTVDRAASDNTFLSGFLSENQTTRSEAGSIDTDAYFIDEEEAAEKQRPAPPKPRPEFRRWPSEITMSDLDDTVHSRQEGSSSNNPEESVASLDVLGLSPPTKVKQMRREMMAATESSQESPSLGAYGDVTKLTACAPSEPTNILGSTKSTINPYQSHVNSYTQLSSQTGATEKAKKQEHMERSCNSTASFMTRSPDIPAQPPIRTLSPPERTFSYSDSGGLPERVPFDDTPKQSKNTRERGHGNESITGASIPLPSARQMQSYQSPNKMPNRLGSSTSPDSDSPRLPTRKPSFKLSFKEKQLRMSESNEAIPILPGPELNMPSKNRGLMHKGGSRPTIRHAMSSPDFQLPERKPSIEMSPKLRQNDDVDDLDVRQTGTTRYIPLSSENNSGRPAMRPAMSSPDLQRRRSLDTYPNMPSRREFLSGNSSESGSASGRRFSSGDVSPRYPERSTSGLSISPFSSPDETLDSLLARFMAAPEFDLTTSSSSSSKHSPNSNSFSPKRGLDRSTSMPASFEESKVEKFMKEREPSFESYFGSKKPTPNRGTGLESYRSWSQGSLMNSPRRTDPESKESQVLTRPADHADMTPLSVKEGLSSIRKISKIPKKLTTQNKSKNLKNS